MAKTAMQKTETTASYLKFLEKEDMEKIREKICHETDSLIDKKAHPMAGGLMSVLSEETVIKHLSVEQMIRIIESIFPPSITEQRWLNKYCNILLRVIDDTSKPTKQDNRAQEYENQVRGVLVPLMQKKAISGKALDNPDTLIDIYKVVACLYRFYKQREKHFIFKMDRNGMENHL